MKVRAAYHGVSPKPSTLPGKWLIHDWLEITREQFLFLIHTEFNDSSALSCLLYYFSSVAFAKTSNELIS